MHRVEGETIPRKILRDGIRARAAEARAAVRRNPRRHPRLAAGGSAATAPHDGGREIADLEREYRAFDWPRPVIELALRWLPTTIPAARDVTLVHGDFRHGNLMVGPDGVRAVLDWELAHLGDPMEDLGWICVNSWRFGEIDKPVGGFGSAKSCSPVTRRPAAGSMPTV